jgi:uncharacterized membrane protein YgcG
MLILMFGTARVGRVRRGERFDVASLKAPALLGVFVLVFLPWEHSAARDIDCSGQLGAIRIDGNLNVAMPCRLRGTTIDGDVRIFAGGSLDADEATINGNLQGSSADFVVLIETFVKGNVHLDELVGDRSRISLSDIDGNVRLRRNRSRFELQDNGIDGNVQVDNNTGGVLILSNSIDGNLSCQGNSPAPAGGNNEVAGRATRQCANLQPEGSGSAASPPPPQPPPPSTSPSPPAASSGSGSGSGFNGGSGTGSGSGSGSGGSSGSGSNELLLNPQPSGGGAAVGPLEALGGLLLLGVVTLLKRRWSLPVSSRPNV